MDEIEIEKCNKVIELFGEMIDKLGDMCIVYTENYGFVVLEYYRNGHFESNVLYNKPEGLFQHLLNKWKLTWIIEKKNESDIEEYDEFLDVMSDMQKEELEQTVNCFEQEFAKII